MKALVRCPNVAIVAWLDLSTAYLLALVLAAATDRNESRIAAHGEDPLRTVTLVPAHNEQSVIAPCVASLLAQDVADGMHRVIVVADNCTDATASVARASGAMVWERADTTRLGKGHALAWAIDKVILELPHTEVVGIVDADCRASENLCSVWSRAIRRGAVGVQADYRIANPAASTAAARRWAGFALMHRVRGAGKERLGLSCGLYGSGMAFPFGTVAAIPLSGESVTEDADYHVRIVTRGGRVAFVRDAFVESPAPLTEDEAQVQQTRWESGRLEIARRATFGLLRDGLAHRDVQRIHAASEFLVPPQSILLAGLCAAGVTARVTGDRRSSLAAAAGVVGQMVYVAAGLTIARAPQSVWRALATAPALVIRKVWQFGRIATGGGSTEWIKTERPM